MRVTAKTTDVDVLSQVARAKVSLVDAATKAMSSGNVCGEQMVQAAQAVRNAEAVAAVQMSYINVSARNPGRRLEFLADVATRGADDGWSGRGNDSRRAANDAVLSWVRDEVHAITHETPEV